MQFHFYPFSSSLYQAEGLPGPACEDDDEEAALGNVGEPSSANSLASFKSTVCFTSRSYKSSGISRSSSTDMEINIEASNVNFVIKESGLEDANKSSLANMHCATSETMDKWNPNAKKKSHSRSSSESGGVPEQNVRMDLKA